MKLRFLCATHRQELELNMEKALEFIQTGLDTGIFYTNKSQWKEAIPHLGCAFEVADILLTQNNLDQEVTCDWLANSAILLAQNLNNVQHTSQAGDVIWLAINRLEAQLFHQPDQLLWMDEYLKPLYAELKTYIQLDAKGPSANTHTSNPLALVH